MRVALHSRILTNLWPSISFRIPCCKTWPSAMIVLWCRWEDCWLSCETGRIGAIAAVGWTFGWCWVPEGIPVWYWMFTQGTTASASDAWGSDGCGWYWQSMDCITCLLLEPCSWWLKGIDAAMFWIDGWGTGWVSGGMWCNLTLGTYQFV